MSCLFIFFAGVDKGSIVQGVPLTLVDEERADILRRIDPVKETAADSGGSSCGSGGGHPEQQEQQQQGSVGQARRLTFEFGGLFLTPT